MFQITAALNNYDVIIWPYSEVLKSGTVHFLLHVVYPQKKTIITMDSLKGARSDHDRSVILRIIQGALSLTQSQLNQWTQYWLTLHNKNVCFFAVVDSNVEISRFSRLLLLTPFLCLCVCEGDDCGAFVAMYAWCVVYRLPLTPFVHHTNVRAFRKHMAFTLLRGSLHFRLPPKVHCNRTSFVAKMYEFIVCCAGNVWDSHAEWRRA